MSRPLLLITATAVEAKPLKEELNWKKHNFPLGELFHSDTQHLGLGTQGLLLAHLGVAKVNTAAGLALLIERLEPEGVVQFGIGGAFPGSCLSVGMLAAADSELHLDTGVWSEDGSEGMEALGFPLVGERYNAFPTDPGLTESISRASGAEPCRFGTSETVTSSPGVARRLRARWDVCVESMEGAAAAQVCYAHRVPFAELRAVSNIVGERDKAAWDLPGAVRRVNEAVYAFLRAHARA